MMKNTPDKVLKTAVSEAIKAVFDLNINEELINIQPPGKGFEGSHTFVVFPLVKDLKLSPEVIGTKIGEYVVQNSPEIENFNVAKGFLNFSFKDTFWAGIFSQLYTSGNYGKLPATGKKIVLEYSSPNTNKPLHLGHLRNNFLGFSVAEILKAAGHEVVKTNIVNDRGIHICKSMLAYQLLGNGETPESAGLKGDHLVGKYYVEFDKLFKKQVEQLVAEGTDKETAEKQAPVLLQAGEMLRKWEAGDEETVALWKKMNEWVYAGFDVTYRAMGVDFDKMYYESDTYLLGKDIVMAGLAAGVLYKKENGSIWADLTGEGLDEKLLLRGDGTSVYITQDLGLADLKYEQYKFDRSIYVVGNEQDYHFEVLKKILSKLGRTYADGIYHLSYGMVELPHGRMKSREGTVVDADDLMAEMVSTAAERTRELGKIDGISEEEAEHLYKILGIGALKYFLLKVDPKKKMLFNPEESIELQGNTGPFIQYTHARIRSMLRKAAANSIEFAGNDYSGITFMMPSEKELCVLLEKFEDEVRAAGELLAPYRIAQYAYDVAKAYNKFYAEVPVLAEPVRKVLQWRLALSDATARTIAAGMLLLGIEVPDRM